jgi:urea transport system permease protein
LRAIRENEGRTESLGYNIAQIKVIVFATSAGLAGFAGALYAPLRLVNPELFSLPLSVMAIIFVAIGGRGTLVGAFIGAVFVNVLQQLLAANSPELWLFVLGLAFIAIVLFFPMGFVGWVARLWRRGREPQAPAAHLEDMISTRQADGGASGNRPGGPRGGQPTTSTAPEVRPL